MYSVQFRSYDQVLNTDDPKLPAHRPYTGTSILKLNFEKSPPELTGKYFTIRGTVGRIELKLEDENPNKNYRHY